MVAWTRFPHTRLDELLEFLREVGFPDVPANVFDALESLVPSESWAIEEDGKIQAWFNLSDVLPGATACFHIAARPEFRKRWSRGLFAQMLSIAFNGHQLYSIWMYTERPSIKKLALSMGFVGGYNGADPNTFTATRPMVKRFLEER